MPQAAARRVLGPPPASTYSASSRGRQDRAHHRHRAGEVQDRDDEPRLQYPSAGSARADGACARLSALTGGVGVSCKRSARRQSGPRSGGHLGTSAATARSAKAGYCSRSHKSVLHYSALPWLSRGRVGLFRVVLPENVSSYKKGNRARPWPVRLPRRDRIPS
jgi:hypothetical protein